MINIKTTKNFVMMNVSTRYVSLFFFGDTCTQYYRSYINTILGFYQKCHKDDDEIINIVEINKCHNFNYRRTVLKIICLLPDYRDF